MQTKVVLSDDISIEVEEDRVVINSYSYTDENPIAISDRERARFFARCLRGAVGHINNASETRERLYSVDQNFHILSTKDDQSVKIAMTDRDEIVVTCDEALAVASLIDRWLSGAMDGENPDTSFLAVQSTESEIKPDSLKYFVTEGFTVEVNNDSTLNLLISGESDQTIFLDEDDTESLFNILKKHLKHLS